MNGELFLPSSAVSYESETKKARGNLVPSRMSPSLQGARRGREVLRAHGWAGFLGARQPPHTPSLKSGWQSGAVWRGAREFEEGWLCANQRGACDANVDICRQISLMPPLAQLPA